MRIPRWLSIIFAISMICGGLGATEFRAPLSIEHGPMRYVIDVDEWDSTDYCLKFWSACYGRESHKAFIKHGTNTDHLSALFFNASCFNIGQIFPGGCVDIATEYYNPFLAVTKLRPRVTYSEKGLALGARFAYPVYKNRGRLGLRVHVPFRKIEIEREDSGDKDTNQLDDLVTGEVVTREGLSDFLGTNALAKDVVARSVRMDFLQAIPYTASKKPLLYFDANGKPEIKGDLGAIWNDPGIPNPYNERIAAVIHSPEGTIPRSPDRLQGIHKKPRTTPPPTALPADGNVSDEKQYAFWSGVDYTPLNMNQTSCTDNVAAQAKASELWITSVHKTSGGGEAFSSGSEAFWKFFDLVMKQYDGQGNIYEWLGDRGFEFESDTRSGLGDLDLDIFYEHMLNDDMVIEAMLGIRFPTGPNDNYCCNPYKVHLGNGGHFEIRPGILFAWQPISWMNIKLDARYSFVLKNEEKRMATFKGACIKNIGPCVKADVDWEYFVVDVDFNLFHPKTDAISTVLGYQFYNKTKDHICYKCKSMQSWLGKKYQLKAGSTTEYEWVENKQDLDPCVATKYTNAIAHRIRFETSFRITQWFELFCGGMYTFAGRHIPRECDCHGGFVVSF